jgi:hypothetical protein
MLHLLRKYQLKFAIRIVGDGISNCFVSFIFYVYRSSAARISLFNLNQAIASFTVGLGRKPFLFVLNLIFFVEKLRG